MAQAYPRIGVTNLIHEHPEVWVSTEDSSYPLENLVDWRPSTFWRPTWAQQSPPDETINIVPVDGQLIPKNAYFRDWSNGASSAPDRWTLVGSGASVARVAALKAGNYAAEITRAGTDCYLQQGVATPADLRGEQITAGFWVKCSVASRARVGVYDGYGSVSYSSYHTGGGSSEFLSVSHTVDYRSSSVVVRLYVDTGDTTATFDCGAIVKGGSLAETPHAQSVTVFAVHGHNLGTIGATVALEGSNDNSSWSSLATSSPSDDSTLWVDLASQSYKLYRLKFSGGSQRVRVAVPFVGTYLQLPELIGEGWDPYARQLKSSTLQTKDGAPLGREVRKTPIRLRLTQPVVDESFLTGDLETFWAHAGDGGNPGGFPFFLQWDDGDHNGDTFFCWVPEDARKSAPLSRGYYSLEFALDILAVAE